MGWRHRPGGKPGRCGFRGLLRTFGCAASCPWRGLCWRTGARAAVVGAAHGRDRGVLSCFGSRCFRCFLRTRSRAFEPPFGRPESLSLACPRESNQREGHPSRSPSGILPPGARSVSAGSRTAHPALRERAHVRVRAPAGLWLRPLAARQGAPLRGHRGRAERVAPPWRRDQSPARGATSQKRKRHVAQIPCVAPSSAGSRRGKAWMFERMDARVHAGRRIPSNAGYGARAASDARQPGRLSLGHFSLAKQREVTRAGRRPDRNALDLRLDSNLMKTKLIVRKPARTCMSKSGATSWQSAARQPCDSRTIGHHVCPAARQRRRPPAGGRRRHAHLTPAAPAQRPAAQPPRAAPERHP